MPALNKNVLFVRENDCSVNLIVSLRVSTLCNPRHAVDSDVLAKRQLEATLD